MKRNGSKKKLVLFDIDGTLIHHLGGSIYVGWPRFIYALHKVFHIDIQADTTGKYRGWIDRQICWDFARQYGVSKNEYDRKFSQVAQALHEFATEEERKGHKMYRPIEEAVNLAKMLKRQNGVYLGLITGNVERMGWWKLRHAGISDIFRFGLFGDDADNKAMLAQNIHAKAKGFFGISFKPRNVVIIGDSEDDVKSGKSIGATIISVTSGGHSAEELRKAKPDLLVDSLMDKQVLDLLGLEQ